MSWEGFLPNFISELLATLLGLGLGIPIGIWVNRLIETWKKKQEKQKEYKLLQTEKKSVLESLKNELEHNIKLLEQIKKEILGEVIFYHLDLSAWRTISFKGISIINNFMLQKEIDQLYYEYEHLQRKIDRHFEFYYSAAQLHLPFKEIFGDLNNSIYLHIRPLLKTSERILYVIKQEIKKIE